MRRTGFPLLALRVAALLALALALVACRREDARTPDGRLVIDYWEKWEGFEKDAMGAVVEKYNASQDKVFVRYISQSQIDRKLLLATAGGNPPDVAGFFSHTVVSYAEKGALLPLDNLMKRDGIREEDYVPSIMHGCKYQGFVWGMPSTPATVTLHYNKRLFREAGLDPERPPQTIAELDEYARKLTKRDSDGKITQLGFSPSDPGWWSPMWAYFFGADLVSADGRELLAEKPATLAAYEWLDRYADDLGRPALRRFEASAGPFASKDNLFIAEKLAMQLQGVWMASFIEQYNPDMEWGAAPFPPMAAGADGTCIVECDMLVIPKGARHVEEAWDFIKFVQRQENMELLCMGQKKFSPLREVSPEFAAKHPNPYIGMFRDLADSPEARGVPRMTLWDEYRVELGMAFEEVWIRDTEPKAALAKLRERVGPRFGRALAKWDLMADQRRAEWSSQ